MAIEDWSTDPDQNGLVLGIDINEDCPAANINNALRSTLANIKSWITGAIFTSPNSGSTGAVRVRDAAGDPDAAYLQFVNNAANSQLGYVRGLKAGGLTFGTNTGEAACITSDGKVGIGTTSPSVPLHVNGETRASAFSLATANVYWNADNNRATFNHDANDTYSYDRVNNLHEFYINGSRQAYIDVAGRVYATTEIVANTLVRIGGLNQFYMNYNGGNPFINFGNGRYLQLDGTAGSFNTVIDGDTKLAIRADGIWTNGSSGPMGAGSFSAAALYDAGHRVLTSASGSAIASQSLGSPGYIRLTNGLTLQWGETGAVGGEGAQGVTFPIAFTSAVFSVSATAKNSGGAGNDIWTQVSSVSTSGFSVYWQAPSSGNSGGGAYWFAIGI